MKTTRARVIGGVLLLLGLVMTSYGLYLALSPNIYQSTVRIKAEKDMQEILGLSGSSSDFDPYWIQTEFEKIQSKTILYPVLTNLNLNLKWAGKMKLAGELRTEETYILLKKKMEVRQSRGSSLIEITVRSEDSREAADIANASAAEYRRNRLATKRELVLLGIKTYRNELDKQNKKIAALEAQVSQSSQELTTTNEVQQELVTIKGVRERFQRRIEQESAALGNLKSNVEIIDRAEPSLKPIYPNKAKMIVLFIFGLLLAVCGVILLNKEQKLLT